MFRSRLNRVVALCLMVAVLPLAGPAANAADPSGVCALPSKPFLGEGSTDYRFHLRPSGTRKGILLFVDFPDVQAADPVTDYRDLLMPAEDWYSEASYGRFTLDLQAPHLSWVRMPGDSGSYGINRQSSPSHQEHKAFMAAAVKAADPDVDFSAYDLLYVVTPKEADQIDYSPAFLSAAGDGVKADGNEMRFGATIAQDIWTPNWGYKVLVHETGHTFGLTDLYSLHTDVMKLHGWVGGWDLMGNIGGYSPDFLAWHRWKLGWLDGSQVDCVTNKGQSDHVLTPVETAGGKKAVVIRTSDNSAYVAENRQATGHDADACDEGILVYKVDSSVESGSGTIRLKDAHPDTSLCGDGFGDAPFGIGDGEQTTFEDAAAGVTIQVLSHDGTDYGIRVTRTSTFVPSPVKHKRDVLLISFALKNDLMTFKGKLAVRDSYARCGKSVSVTLQRNSSGHWRTVASTKSSTSSAFTLKEPFRTGKYRIKAPQAAISGVPKNVCLAAATTAINI